MNMDNPNLKRSTLIAMSLGLVGAAAAAATSRAASKTSHPLADQDVITRLVAQAQITDARQQISEVLHRYARGADRVDEAAMRSCFHADSTHQHGSFKGTSQDFVTNAMKIVSGLKSCTHMITNVSIDIVGDKAVSECYFLAHHRRTKKTGDGEQDWFLKGRYVDRFEKRDGLWKITHRRGLHDFSRTFEPADTSLDTVPLEQLSLHSTSDPMYAMLADLHAGH
jgi:hypothetical protein